MRRNLFSSKLGSLLRFLLNYPSPSGGGPHLPCEGLILPKAFLSLFSQCWSVPVPSGEAPPSRGQALAALSPAQAGSSLLQSVLKGRQSCFPCSLPSCQAFLHPTLPTLSDPTRSPPQSLTSWNPTSGYPLSYCPNPLSVQHFPWTVLAINSALLERQPLFESPLSHAFLAPPLDNPW